MDVGTVSAAADMSVGDTRVTAGIVSVRDLQIFDLEAVAQIHRRAFSDGAMTRLGDGIIRRYYDWLCNPVHDADRRVAMCDDQVVGFCFAGIFQGAMSGFLRRNWWALLRAVASRPSLLAEARFRRRAFTGGRLLWRMARRRPARNNHPASLRASGDRSFGILVIATDPLRQQSGVGRALMAAAESEARRRACDVMRLSVHPENERAVRFYERLGWCRVPRQGAWHGEMERQLSAREHRGHSPGA